jgi:hypothetical protein
VAAMSDDRPDLRHRTLVEKLLHAKVIEQRP